MNLGKNIKTLREAHGLSQNKLAESVGIAQSKISDMERGATLIGRLATLQKLANFFGLEKPDDLFNEEVVAGIAEGIKRYRERN